MARKEQIGVTKDRAKYRCPDALKRLIDSVNWIDDMNDLLDKRGVGDPNIADQNKALCKGVHEIAQIAALPQNMWLEYSRAVVGTGEEWEKFCVRLPAQLWRKWPNLVSRLWPQITIMLFISDDGLINSPGHDIMTALIGVEAKRLKECRHCQHIFWALRIDMVACGKRCATALRQRTFRESKKP
jgi:hypothetical protein